MELFEYPFARSSSMRAKSTNDSSLTRDSPCFFPLLFVGGELEDVDSVTWSNVSSP